VQDVPRPLKPIVAPQAER